MAHAQWQITYSQATPWDRFWAKQNAMMHDYGTVNNSSHSYGLTGGSVPYNVNNITLYHSVDVQGFVTITVTWIGSPASEPATVHLKITTTASGEYTGARYPGIITLNDGFGNSYGTQSHWYESGSGTYGGTGSITGVNDLGTFNTNGQAQVYYGSVLMNEQTYAQLRPRNPGSSLGTPDTYITTDFNVVMEVVP